jgi:2-succinyl-5-enolpyruvyl-6-hydroxy-3-cyclohexene-1-carboxylate synthase
MPQPVDGALLCAAHGVPHRHLEQPEALQASLDWLLQQPLAVLEISTDRSADAERRRRLRTMAAAQLGERWV